MPSRKKARRLPDVSVRVRLLIDRHHEGDVTRAAHAIDIPQPTLHRIVAGKFKHGPRLEALERIAEAYDVSPAWLVYGKGPAPPSVSGLPMPLWREWYNAIAPLALPRDVEHAVLRLPFTIRAVVGLTPNGGHDPRDLSAPLEPEFIEAMALEVRAWRLFLRGWIRVSRLKTVRDALIREFQAGTLGVGFNWLAVAMLRNGAIARGDVATVAAAAAAEGAEMEKALTETYGPSRSWPAIIGAAVAQASLLTVPSAAANDKVEKQREHAGRR